MAITAVSSTKAFNTLSSETSTNFTVDIGTRTNGLLVVAMMMRNAGSVPSFTTPTYNGVSMSSVSQVGHDSGGLFLRTGIAYLVNPSNGSNTLTINLDASYSSFVQIMASWYDGAHQTQGEVLLAAMTTGTGSTDPSIGSATPSENNALVVAAYTSEENTALTIGGWGTELQNHGANGWSRGCGYVIQTTATAVTATWTGTDATWCGVMGFFKALADSNVTAAPPAGSLSMTGVAASLAFAIVAGAGALNITGAAPTVTVDGGTTIAIPAGGLTNTGAYISAMFAGPDSGALTFTGSAPTLAIGPVITNGAGSLTFTGAAPLLAQTITPPAGSVVLTGAAPTVTVSGETTIAVPVGALTFTGVACTVLTPQTISLPVGALTFTGSAPSITGEVAITPGVGALAMTGAAPLLAFTITPPVGSVAVTGVACTLLTPQSIAVPVGALTFTGSVPTPADSTIDAEPAAIVVVRERPRTIIVREA